jgi:hypothetical protein
LHVCGPPFPVARGAGHHPLQRQERRRRRD